MEVVPQLPYGPKEELRFTSSFRMLLERAQTARMSVHLYSFQGEERLGLEVTHPALSVQEHGLTAIEELPLDDLVALVAFALPADTPTGLPADDAAWQEAARALLVLFRDLCPLGNLYMTASFVNHQGPYFALELLPNDLRGRVHVRESTLAEALAVFSTKAGEEYLLNRTSPGQLSRPSGLAEHS
jgi:hypothetical protein